MVEDEQPEDEFDELEDEWGDVETDTIVIDDAEAIIPPLSTVCTYCVHLDLKRVRACAAFDSIPMPIWMGQNDHTRPYEGDNGIRFQSVI